MKNAMVPIVLAAGLILVISFPCSASAGTLDDARYDTSREKTFEGIVASTAHMSGETMYFTLRSKDGVKEVELGPKKFFDQSGFTLKVGETATVFGISETVRGRETVVAREVRTMGRVYVSRDRNGFPIWDANRPIQMDPEFSESGLCEMIMP
jgi:hypothetical protein